ncbi:MAG: Ig-like domain-containing protein, partial [Gemmatimonadales bacterium]
YTSNVATFTPTAALTPATTYTVTVSTGVRDANGNALAGNDSYNFTTIDNIAPTIVSRSPAPGATNVATSATVQVGFSEPMDASTITSSTFTLSSGGAVAGAVTYNPATRVATFTPGAALGSAQSYTVTVTTGVRDAAGNALAANDVFSFTTVDNTPPTIVSRTPSAGATDVAANTTVEVGFSEPMDASSITIATFKVSAGGTGVTGAVTYNPATRVATFTPSAPLTAGQTYSVTVTTGVRDAAGNALAADDVFSFTIAL